MLRRRVLWLLVASLMSLMLFAEDANEALFEAARKGDVEGVKALIAKGVDVNATWRYETTALLMAARRGHVEVAKVLLENGAKVNVKDSFYGMTPLSGAAGNGSAELVKILLEKGAEGKDAALLTGVGSNNLDVVKVVLAQGGLKPETLSRALARATRNNRTPIAEALKQAGALPGPQPDFQVEVETLQRYAGTYRDERGTEFAFTVKDGKLSGGPSGQSFVLGAFDKVTFQPLQFDEVTIIFQLEGEKVTGFTMKQGETTQVFKRVETK